MRIPMWPDGQSQRGRFAFWQTVQTRIGMLVTALLLPCFLTLFQMAPNAIAVADQAFTMTQAGTTAGVARPRRDVSGLSENAQLPLMRAMSVGGNWGGNIDGFKNIPDAFVQYLVADNVNWVGIKLPIFNASISDPTVAVRYRPANDTNYGNMYSFADADLINAVAKFKRNGMNVYFSLILMQPSSDQSGCGTAQYGVDLHLIGDTDVPADETSFVYRSDCIDPSLWWWKPSHPNHAANVAAFWSTYTQVAAKYAKLAQQLDVGMFAVGEETGRLFRTRPSARFPNDFKTQLTELITAVRAEYHGLVTYGQQVFVYHPHPEWWGLDNVAGGSLFKDLSLDVVAISAAFSLTGAPVTRVYSVAELVPLWESVFRNYLLPLQAANPGIPIIFSDIAAVDTINAPDNPLSQTGEVFVFSDLDGNGKDDGREQQSNLFEALLRANANFEYLLRGTMFAWSLIDTDPFIARWYETHRAIQIHGKPVEQAIREIYGSYAALPGAPQNLSTSAGASTATLVWSAPVSGNKVVQYRIEVGSKPGLSDIAAVDTGNGETTYQLKASSAGNYFVRVKAKGVGSDGPSSNEIVVSLKGATSDVTPRPKARWD